MSAFDKIEDSEIHRGDDLRSPEVYPALRRFFATREMEPATTVVIRSRRRDQEALEFYE